MSKGQPARILHVLCVISGCVVDVLGVVWMVCVLDAHVPRAACVWVGDAGTYFLFGVCVCVCVLVCLSTVLNNFKEGGPHGSRAPSSRLRRQLRRQVVHS